MKTLLLSIIPTNLILAILVGWSVAAPAPEAGRPKEIASFQAHRFDIEDLAFSPDGKTLATGGREGNIRLWDADSWKNRLEIKAHSPGRRGGHGMVSNLAFSPDGKTLATSGDDFTVKLWDVASGENTEVFNNHAYSSPPLLFSPDGKALVARYELIDLKTKRTRKIVDEPGLHPVAAFDPKGKLLFATSFMYPNPPSFALWDVKTGKKVLTWKDSRKVVSCSTFSPDGKSVVSTEGDYDGGRWAIRLWDTVTGKNTATFEQPDLPYCPVFSPDGKILAVAGTPGADRNDYPSTIRLLEIPSGKVLATLKGHRRPIGKCLAFSPDGKLLASGDSRGTIKIWRLPAHYAAEKEDAKKEEKR